ncbi:chromosome partitioning protein ParB [Helicobacter enhydrae]|uniref:Chromosome partitioning protein ParB n=1 Tax=Helicobacter enhydrae TaxID=222136 RepID=A0A1B1U6V5_9HELI|nr:ParB/RepB/Spo0J family partition protein [Helicobacter enhydrae]ANV98451.1 chromosome partitioning protein ParB [Helicobacter enhydrae]
MQGKKRQVLGRGLSELLSETERAYENHSGNQERVVELEIDEVIPNPYQPRKTFNHEALDELAASIKEYGLLQPILVYQNEKQEYVLIAGERRLRASKLAGLESIKAIVAEIDLKYLQEFALIENIQREDLNPIELAQAYSELVEKYHLTHEELAQRIQKSRAQVTNTIRMMQLEQEVQEMLVTNAITQGHAKILVALPRDEQLKIAHSIVGQKLSVSQTEQMVKKFKSDSKKSPKNRTQDTNEMSEKCLELCEVLQSYCHSVKLNGSKLMIEFASQTQIADFLEKIKR